MGHLQVQQGAGAATDITPTQVAELVAAIGLANVDNTRDADKPISTAQATVNTSVAGTLSAHSSAITALQSPPVVNLTDGYVLSSADEGKKLIAPADLAISISYPPGVAWTNGCLIEPAATGSVTITPTGGATINGSTAPEVISFSLFPVPAALVPTAVTNNAGLTGSTVRFQDLTGDPTASALLTGYLLATFDPLMPPPKAVTGGYTLQTGDHRSCIWLTAQTATQTITVPGNIANGLSVWECDVFLYNPNNAVGRIKVALGSGAALKGCYNYVAGAVDNAGALQNSPFFGGVPSASCIAHGRLRCFDFTTNANRFFFTPIAGRWQGT